MLTNLDIVDECDVFPYPDKDAEAHAALLKTLYTLVWDGVPIGFILSSVLERILQVPVSIRGEFEVDRTARTVSAFRHLPNEAERSRVVAATAAYLRDNKVFDILSGWRNELYPVYGPKGELLFSIERAASSLFGIATYGVHMHAFVRDETASYGLKVWIPRRSKTKQTYPGMLDNTVGGGIATGEDRFESLVREAQEEASLPEALVRGNVSYHGTVTYTYIRESRAGGESGLVQPECEYIYDLELPADVLPKPNDSEVEEFYLWTVEEIQRRMAKGEFKPNCALIMLDFFIRHGILTKENEKNYGEIQRRLHRDLGLPGPHNE